MLCSDWRKRGSTKRYELVVTSTLTRSQADNVEDALAKMQACMDSAAESLIPPEVDPRESEANCQTEANCK
ncbi:hypothetical protein WJX75_007064 [Coccomyxa subellipsoidea]|uniref:Uncharacterized protein n=1 Tax=Coccomyxa subellipsoidea TaxID=248742 RepID=A0ABR2YLI6_9CHLO